MVEPPQRLRKRTHVVKARIALTLDDYVRTNLQRLERRAKYA
jgi:hypothetical protein